LWEQPKNQNSQKNLVLQDRTQFYSNTQGQDVVAAVQGLEDQVCLSDRCTTGV